MYTYVKCPTRIPTIRNMYVITYYDYIQYYITDYIQYYIYIYIYIQEKGKLKNDDNDTKDASEQKHWISQRHIIDLHTQTCSIH